MKYFYHLALTICIVFSLLSYQRAFASAKGFVEKKVRTGDNVISLLRQYDFDPSERSRVLAQSRALRDLYLQLDVKYLVKQSRGFTEIRFYEPQQDTVFTVIKRGRDVEVKKARAPFKTKITRVEGKVYGSLMANILSKVNSNWVASRFIDAYIMDYNLEKTLSRGANFWFTVEKKYDGPFFIRYRRSPPNLS